MRTGGPAGSRRIRYSVAMSLDGYIADREGGYDWIIDEPGIDFEAYLAKIDTLILGRGTYETLRDGPTGVAAFEAFDLYVVSTTLDPADADGVTLIGEDVVERVRRLKEASLDGASIAPATDVPSGQTLKDIWLFGGGVLFRSLLEAGLVDRVEVGLVPVLLGDGIPVLPGLGESPNKGSGAEGANAARPAAASLDLHSIERFDSGIVLIKYDVR